MRIFLFGKQYPSVKWRIQFQPPFHQKSNYYNMVMVFFDLVYLTILEPEFSISSQLHLNGLIAFSNVPLNRFKQGKEHNCNDFSCQIGNFIEKLNFSPYLPKQVNLLDFKFDNVSGWMDGRNKMSLAELRVPFLIK